MRSPLVPAASCALAGLLTVGAMNVPEPVTLQGAGTAPASAIVSGDLIYVSGTIGARPGTAELPEGIEAQVRQAIENVRAALSVHGADLSSVLSANVFLSDARNFQAMNRVYRTYFAQDPPTRATVQADLVVPAALVQIAVIAARPEHAVKVIHPDGLRTPQLPYSWGKQVGNTLFIAGATSRSPETYEPVPGDMAAQTRQILHNIGEVLRSAEMNYRDVVSCKVFLTDARLFRVMNEAYGSVFREAPPARATVRTALVNPRFLAEVQCVAVQDPGRRVVVAEGGRLPRSPYSPAIQVGDRLYLAGMVGGGPNGFARGDVTAQTRQTLENLRNTLAAAGMDFGHVVEATIFVGDIRHRDLVNDVYRETLGSDAPNPTTVGAQLMSPDLLVEIMMTASQ